MHGFRSYEIPEGCRPHYYLLCVLYWGGGSMMSGHYLEASRNPRVIRRISLQVLTKSDGVHWLLA